MRNLSTLNKYNALLFKAFTVDFGKVFNCYNYTRYSLSFSGFILANRKNAGFKKSWSNGKYFLTVSIKKQAYPVRNN